MADVIVAKGLARYFGSKAAIDDISLRVPQGCVFCIAGPNGSGKTTLLNMLGGVLKPSRGSIEMRRLSVGYAYQHPKLSDDLSVNENLRFFSKIGGGEEEWMRELIKEMKLEDITNRNAEELSSGMRKRLELVVSLLSNPDVILMDEPTAGLDMESTKEALEIIKFLKKKGKTVVVATHQLENLGGICERLAVLNEGRVAVEMDVKKMSGRKLLQVYSSALGKD